MDMDKLFGKKRDSDEIWVTEFTADAALDFRDELIEASKSDPLKPIIVYIHSYGGAVDALASMIETMDEIPNPIITVCQGVAMSCGAMLLSHGDIRFIGKHSRVMIHEVSGGTAGDVHDIGADAQEIKRLNRHFMNMLAKNCNIKGGYDALRKMIKDQDGRDRYMNAEESVKFGIVDAIGMPRVNRMKLYQVEITPPKDKITKTPPKEKSKDCSGAADFWTHFEVPMPPELKEAFAAFSKDPSYANQQIVKHQVYQDEVNRLIEASQSEYVEPPRIVPDTNYATYTEEECAALVDGNFHPPLPLKSADAKTLTIAVIDSGVDFSLPSLCKFGHKSFATALPNPLADEVGHGTHVAGIIGANAGPGNYCIVSIKYYDAKATGKSNLANMVKAIQYAINIKVDFINISGGGPDSNEDERIAIMRALKKKIRVVVAAGNEGDDLDKKCNYFPACYDNRIVTVGNLQDVELSRSPSSDYGNYVKRWEVGTNVLSTLPGGRTGTMTGTSQAAAVATVGYLACRAPEIHGLILRQTVGSKVYMIKGKVDGGGGTGFAVKAPSGQNYIVTNSHVCEGALTQSEDKTALLVMDDSGVALRRRIIQVSDFTDLCLLEGMPGVEGLSVGDEPFLGETQYIVGYPHLRPLSVSKGEIVGVQDVYILAYVMKGNPVLEMMGYPTSDAKCDLPKQQIETIEDERIGTVSICLNVTKATYTTTIVIFPGNSGSPLVNFYGQVTGVAFASDGTNWGQIVSNKDLKKFLLHY
ncbi:unnamed protein product [Sphagnum balticum]